MADNRKLNPGQDHYDELYSHNGQIDDVDNQAANNWNRDYSDISPISGHDTAFDNGPIIDYNNSSRDYLNQGEQASVIQGINNQSNLSKRENDASHQTSGFDNAEASRKQKYKMYKQTSRFKRHLLATGLTLLGVTGMAIAGFTAVSGPMQLIQAAELFKDFNMGIQLSQQTTRSFRSMKDIIAHNDTSTMNDNVRNSRLGVLGNIQANKMADRLSQNGVTFSNNNPFGGVSSTDIDIAKNMGIDPTDLTDDDFSKIIRNFAEETGIPASKISHNGTSLQIENTLSSREMRQLISTLDDPGASSVAGYMQSRALTKKLGYTSWLHPFQKITTKAENLAGDALDSASNRLRKFIDEQFGPIDQKAGIDVSGRLTSDDEDPDSSATQEDIDDAKSKVNEAVDEASEKAKNMTSPSSGGGRGIIKSARNFVNSTGYDIASWIFMVVCLAQSIYSNNGVAKFVSVVIPLISGAAQAMGAGSQVQTGEDIDMETAELQVDTMMYNDDIPVIDAETGEPTGETETSSFWSNPKICQTLGTTGCPQESETNTPSVFYTAGDNINITGNSALDGALNQILNDNNLGGQITGGICFVYNIVDGLAGLLTPIQSLVGGVISEAINQTGAMDALVSALTRWLSGNPVALTSAIPIVWGAIGMFGSFFMAGTQSIQTGGTALSGEQTSELNLENRRYLAWQNDRKPILARLFDPSDYNSSLNQIARAAQLNVGDQSLGTQIANVFKAFTSAPSIIATASNQLIGGNAYAAASVDYGVPMIAWDSSTMNEVLSDDRYNIYDNANRAIELLKNDDPNSGDGYHAYAKRCLAVSIDTDDYSVEPLENSNGEQWNYVDNITNDNDYCASRYKRDDYRSINLYAMDYFNTASGACYYGDEGDSEANSACSEMGVDTAGLNGGIALGSDDPVVYQQAFAQYMKDNYSVEGLNVCDNGCTTVPAWFVSQYTTLQYGQGNGWQVAKQLADKNGLEVTHTLDSNCKLPAVFSSYSQAMGSVSECDNGAAPNGLCGHTGLVVSMDDNGTIQILESGSSKCDTEDLSWIQTRTRAEWEGNADFVCLGDYLK